METHDKNAGLRAVEEGLAEIAKGNMIIVVDDESRENEGDLVMAAHLVTAEAINFMAHRGCGLICVPMKKSRLHSLEIEQMVERNTEGFETAFTVSVDEATCTTGISAEERARTIRCLSDPASRPGDFRKPGHIFPLAARENGVLERQGHTEAAVDIVRLATGVSNPAGVICEIMNDDGTMARADELRSFAKTHGLKFVTIADLAHYREITERIVSRATETRLPTAYGEFRLIAYEGTRDTGGHLALVMGDIANGKPVLCRVHSECLTGDALGSRRCDCGEQYTEAMKRIGKEGRGVLVYLRQEGRGIGLINKLKAYALQDGGLDTVDANVQLGFRPDMRDYRVGVEILKDLGIEKIRVLTNNPSKIEGLEKYGIEITETIPILTEPNESNAFYLQTKKQRMNHRLGSRTMPQGIVQQANVLAQFQGAHSENI